MALLKLPPEIIIQIFVHLPLLSVLRTRLVCAELAVLSRDQGLWFEIWKQSKSGGLILPDSPLNIDDWETTILDAYRRAILWPRKRAAANKKLVYTLKPADPLADGDTDGNLLRMQVAQRGEPVVSVHVLQERYLLAIHTDGLVLGYDLKDRRHIYPKLRHSAPTPGCTSTTVGLEVSKNRVVLCLCCDCGPSTETLVVHIQLPQMHVVSTSRIQHFAPEIVHHIDTEEQLVFFGRMSSSVVYSSYSKEAHLLFLEGDDNETYIQSTQDNGIEDLAEVWNGILAVVKIPCQDAVLLFRHQSVEVHFFRQKGHLPAQKHLFPKNSFRSVSLTPPCLAPELQEDVEAATSGYVTHALAYDVYRGLHQLVIRLEFPTSGTSASACPTLNVCLLRKHEFSFGTPAAGLPIITALCLSEHGHRAVWVERARGITLRRVKVWPGSVDAFRACEDDIIYPPEENEGGLDMEQSEFGQIRQTVASDGEARTSSVVERSAVVHEVASYDLRDDVLLAAIGERDGRIVLCNRSGHIQVLELDIS